MNRTSRAELLVLAVVLVGASTFAIARMAPADTRTLPYQGVLEQNGGVANGDYLMRFGLFVTPPDATAAQCVANDNCVLWSEEQLVTVTAGRFSVLLGDSDADLTDQILNNETLHLVMAVKPVADPGVFTLLDGAQEIVPQPWAARAAAANNFRVRGALTVDGASSVAALTASGNISAPNVSVTNTVTATTLTATTINNSNRVTTANLTVNNGLPITKSVVVNAANANGGGPPVTVDTGVAIGRSMCFLTRMAVHDAMANESLAECSVSEGASNWILSANSDLGDADPDVDCSARCIVW